jgi:hypothetical protein
MDDDIKKLHDLQQKHTYNKYNLIYLKNKYGQNKNSKISFSSWNLFKKESRGVYYLRVYKSKWRNCSNLTNNTTRY